MDYERITVCSFFLRKKVNIFILRMFLCSLHEHDKRQDTKADRLILKSDISDVPLWRSAIEQKLKICQGLLLLTTKIPVQHRNILKSNSIFAVLMGRN